jgi:DNA (cytosine-5)-methyltransferase 1
MKALDLYCCDGGAAMGLHKSGFDKIVGIDIEPHPNYPFEFIQADVLKTDPSFLLEFDFIWSSPPCQRFTTATGKNLEYPNLIPQTRELLSGSKKAYVIENVPDAPIRKDLMLCGSMFGLKTYRHRNFEIFGFRCEQPLHRKHTKSTSTGEMWIIVGSSPMMPGCFGDKERRKELRKMLKTKIELSGGTLKLYQDVMGINWTDNKFNIAEAVPPAYSEYIGKEFLRSYKKVND